MSPATLIALGFATAVAASAQITLTGVVRDAADSSPIPDAHVLAVAGRPRNIVGDAVTDAQGRYRLETSSPRFELRIEAPGYYVARAGGVEAESLSRACPEQGDCGEADFLLSRAAVVEGWITDAFGNPQQSLDVMLKPNRPQGQADDSRRPLIMPTQDPTAPHAARRTTAVTSASGACGREPIRLPPTSTRVTATSRRRLSSTA